MREPKSIYKWRASALPDCLICLRIIGIVKNLSRSRRRPAERRWRQRGFAASMATGQIVVRLLRMLFRCCRRSALRTPFNTSLQISPPPHHWPLLLPCWPSYGTREWGIGSRDIRHVSARWPAVIILLQVQTSYEEDDDNDDKDKTRDTEAVVIRTTAATLKQQQLERPYTAHLYTAPAWPIHCQPLAVSSSLAFKHAEAAGRHLLLLRWMRCNWTCCHADSLSGDKTKKREGERKKR